MLEISTLGPNLCMCLSSSNFNASISSDDSYCRYVSPEIVTNRLVAPEIKTSIFPLEIKMYFERIFLKIYFSLSLERSHII